MGNGEAEMQEALDQQQAAETLRSVEGMRRRTIAAVNRLSPVPPLIFGLATLIAAPFTLLTSYRVLERRDDLPDSARVFVIGPDVQHNSIAAIVAIGVATIAAVVLTSIHYRRQQVHPPRTERKPMSSGEAVLFAALAIFFGPAIVSVFLAMAPTHGGWTAIPFAALTVASLVMARVVMNGALGVASISGFVIAGLSPFMWTDHWEFIAAVGYAGSFLLAALIVRYAKRRSA